MQLGRLSKIGSILSKQILETAMHAFVSSRLDYCNLLQFVYYTTRLAKKGKRKCITVILASLHWLPITLRIDLLSFWPALYWPTYNHW